MQFQIISCLYFSPLLPWPDGHHATAPLFLPNSPMPIPLHSLLLHQSGDGQLNRSFIYSSRSHRKLVIPIGIVLIGIICQISCLYERLLLSCAGTTVLLNALFSAPLVMLTKQGAPCPLLYRSKVPFEP